MCQHLRLFVVYFAVLFSPWIGAEARAQGKPLACMVEASGGLHWEAGRWISTGFTNRPRFVLVLQGNNLDPKSVERAIGEGAGIQCESIFRARISCSDESGGYLMFDPVSNRGAFAHLIGGLSTSPNRDSLVVNPFVCQPF